MIVLVLLKTSGSKLLWVLRKSCVVEIMVFFVVLVWILDSGLLFRTSTAVCIDY